MQDVAGSSPVGSIFRPRQSSIYACAIIELCRRCFVESFRAGGVAKWPKATVCKTVIRGFDSHRRLFSLHKPLTNDLSIIYNVF